MILVDTSVWIDHLRQGDAVLQQLLLRGQILGHPLILGELAMGNLRQRELVLGDLQELPQAVMAREPEVRAFVDAQRLFGLGIGYLDAHLLAAIRLTPDSRLWTRDKRLNAIAQELGLGADGVLSTIIST